MVKRRVIAAVIVVVAGTLGLRVALNQKSAGATPDAAALVPPSSNRTVDARSVRSLYVSPDGRHDADGSREHPFDLATALSESSPAAPGDTIFLREGVYVGSFKSQLRGAESDPITVRAYPGERVVLSAATPREPVLTVSGLSTWFCCFEIMNPKPERTSEEIQNVSIRQGVGATIGTAAHIKFINLLVHDLEGGFIIPPEAPDVELYGNIVYSNGWQRADGVGEGHGILSPNQTDGRFIRDNIVFDNFSHGIQAYGNHLDNIYIEGNAIFDNGAIARFLDRNLMVGPGSRNLTVSRNMTYYSAGPAAIGEGVNIGFGGDCQQARIVDNYLTGSNPLNLTGCDPVEMRGNTLHGRFDSAYARRFPENQYMMPKPPPLPTMTGIRVFVRPNHYEPARTHLVVYNWDRLPSVNVDVGPGTLQHGDDFEIRSAHDFYGEPVVTGTYKGGSLSIPMRGLAPLKPIGAVTTPPPVTTPEFAVFVLINKSTVHRPAAQTEGH